MKFTFFTTQITKQKQLASAKLSFKLSGETIVVMVVVAGVLMMQLHLILDGKQR